MSANNWSVCPRCLVVERERAAKASRELADKYGKIPQEEYLEAALALREEQDEENTLREDWSIGVREDGRFTVEYRCRCTVCNFAYEYSDEIQAIIL